MLFQLWLVRVSRTLPWKSLPPDFVTVLTMPPAKRPYSAEMPEVEVVVSSMASSMNRAFGWPRRLSFTFTPLIEYVFSHDWAPEMVIAPAGPVAAAPGERATAASCVRGRGSASRTSCETVLALVLSLEMTVAASPVTSIVSVTAASDMSTSTCSACEEASLEVRLCVSKPSRV